MTDLTAVTNQFTDKTTLEKNKNSLVGETSVQHKVIPKSTPRNIVSGKTNATAVDSIRGRDF